MTKAVLTSPFNTISKHRHSHRAAQAVMYFDQLKTDELNITLDYGQIDNFDEFDELYCYHGNDWGGTLNLFGGMENYSNIDNVIRYSNFKGQIYSLVIDHPDYHSMLQKRMDNKKINPKWNNVNWDQLLKNQNESITYYPNDYKRIQSRKLVVGDSHAICMYRPGWKVNSIPFKTLHGALKIELINLLTNPIEELDEVELYFGNIDIRHHLCRHDEDATISLVRKYFKQANDIARNERTVRIYEPLPIENESRPLPKTGYYKGTPFYGNWEQRNHIRNIFIEECKNQQSRFFNDVKFVQWTDYLCNSIGELDFQYMEKPKSVHLSRAAYPHWQGPDFNNVMSSTLEDLFDEA